MEIGKWKMVKPEQSAALPGSGRADGGVLQKQENTRVEPPIPSSGQACGGRYLGEGFQFALEADAWVVVVVYDYQIILEMLAAAASELRAGNPLAAYERSFGDVFDGLAVPGDGADDGVVIGGENGIANGGGGINVLGALENVERHLEEGVQVAERLGPLLFGSVFVGGAEFGGVFSGEAGAIRETWRPPDFRAQARAAIAEHFDGGGEENAFGDAGDFRLEALLARLLPECCERRRRKHAGENFDIGFFESGDVRGIIGGGSFEAAGIDEFESLRLQRRGEAELGVGVGDAFRIAGPERADDFVGGNGTPHGGEDGDEVFESPEKMIGPVEALLGRAATAEEPGLPGRVGGDAGNAVLFALVADGIDGGAGAGGDHQIHVVGFDQVGGDFSRVFLIGLAVLFDDLNGIRRAVDQYAVRNGFADSGEDKVVAFTEAGENARARADETDLERAACGSRGFSEEQMRSNARHHGGCHGVLQEAQAAGCGAAFFVQLVPRFRLVAHAHSPIKKIPRLTCASSCSPCN